jgi:hypothetical protein
MHANEKRKSEVKDNKMYVKINDIMMYFFSHIHDIARHQLRELARLNSNAPSYPFGLIVWMKLPFNQFFSKC